MSNIFTCVGRVGSDAEQRQTNSGSVLTFSLANDTGYGDRKRTQWIRCAIFGKRAEGKLAGYLVKGAQVYVSGELSCAMNEKGGKSYLNLDLAVREIELVGGKARQEDPPSSQLGEPDDDLPF